MGFAVRQTARPGGANSWRFQRVHRVDIEGNVDAARALKERDRFIHAWLDAALVDLTHGEHTHAELTDNFALAWIKRPRAEQDDPTWIYSALCQAQSPTE